MLEEGFGWVGNETEGEKVFDVDMYGWIKLDERKSRARKMRFGEKYQNRRRVLPMISVS